MPRKPDQYIGPNPIRLLIVDDHPMVREGLRAFLSRQAQLKIVAEACDLAAALVLAQRWQPDIVLMDVNLPDGSGVSAIPDMKRVAPRTRILMVTVHTRIEYIHQMIQAGAHGYVAKDASPSTLLRAIGKVARGDAHFDSRSALTYLQERLSAPNCVVLDPASRLAPREREVLTLLSNGQSNKEIAVQLGLSVRTVETHRERLKRKLGLRTIAQLIRFALANNLSSLS